MCRQPIDRCEFVGGLAGDVLIRGVCLRQLTTQLRQRCLRQCQPGFCLLRIHAPALPHFGQPRHLRQGFLMALFVLFGEDNQVAQSLHIEVGLRCARGCGFGGVAEKITSALCLQCKAPNLARCCAAIKQQLG